MPSRRATREAGPATTERDELIEAIGHLRADSDRVYAEWQQAVRLRHKETKSRAWKRWGLIHRRMDSLCESVQLYDALQPLALNKGQRDIP